MSSWRLGAYSTLQLPLAMAALPIVLNVSHFYGKHFAVNLTLIGVIFLVTRLIDAIQDPLIGYFSDRLTHRRNGRLWMAICSVPILGAGFFAVFSPPDLTGHAMLLYLLVALIVVHLGYSGVSISYHSLGAELSYDYNERTRVTIWREVFGILGLLLGAALPPYLVTLFGEVPGHERLAVTFLPILLVPAVLIWVFKPRPVTPPVPNMPFGIRRVFAAPFRNKRFRTLLTVYLINGSAVAIAASVVLFFIDDIIERPQYKVWFILAYFASGMLSVPFWLWLSRRTSKSAAWFAGIMVSSVGMMAAIFLGPGDVTGYLIICVLSGFGLGADYGLPPSILADVIHNEVSDSQGESGKYFGLWAMATKITTAIGGGIALPVLDTLGYVPGNAQSGWALILVYAALPALVKLGALIWLWRIRVESAKPSVRKQWRQYRSLITQVGQ
ncbi:MAG: MFS transporter [Reyranellaceae bacterium]